MTRQPKPAPLKDEIAEIVRQARSDKKKGRHKRGRDKKGGKR